MISRSALIYELVVITSKPVVVMWHLFMILLVRQIFLVDVKLLCVYVYVGVGALAFLPLNACGRFSGFPLITGHSAQITDFSFSPFKSELLATGSDDCMVKLWDIPAEDRLEVELRLNQSVMNLGPLSVSCK